MKAMKADEGRSQRAEHKRVGLWEGSTGQQAEHQESVASKQGSKGQTADHPKTVVLEALHADVEDALRKTLVNVASQALTSTLTTLTATPTTQSRASLAATEEPPTCQAPDG